MPCTNSHSTHAPLIAKSLLYDKEIQEARLKVNVPKIHSRHEIIFMKNMYCTLKILLIALGYNSMLGNIDYKTPD